MQLPHQTMCHLYNVSYRAFLCAAAWNIAITQHVYLCVYVHSYSCIQVAATANRLSAAMVRSLTDPSAEPVSPFPAQTRVLLYINFCI